MIDAALPLAAAGAPRPLGDGGHLTVDGALWYRRPHKCAPRPNLASQVVPPTLHLHGNTPRTTTEIEP